MTITDIVVIVTVLPLSAVVVIFMIQQIIYSHLDRKIRIVREEALLNKLTDKGN